MPTPTTSSPTFGGIDPGASGAIGLLGLTASVYDLPWSADKIVKFFRETLLIEDRPLIFAIEVPQPVPHQKARSIATFWQKLGFVEGVMSTLGIPFQEVRPQDWRRAMGCRVKGTDEAKKWSRATAAQLYPYLDLGKRQDEGRSDSIIIATYAKRLYETQRGRNDERREEDST